MRTNLEGSLLQNVRHMSSRFSVGEFTLTGPFVIPEDGPVIWALDAGGVSRDVYLPELELERFHVIANKGVTGVLAIHDADAVSLIDIQPNAAVMFFAGTSEWSWLSGSDLTGFTSDVTVVTAAGTVTVTHDDTKIIINKAVASPTPINLPTVAGRNGKPLLISDWAGNVDIANPVTITPDGAETINNLASWEASSLSSGGITLYPSVTLNGWVVGG